MKSQKRTYHIIGGGIAGLACAWLLRQKKKNAHIALYEAKDYVGGRAVATKNDADRILKIISKKDLFLSLFAKSEDWKRHLCFFDMKTKKLENKVRRNMDVFYKIFGGETESHLAEVIQKQIKHLICSRGILHHDLWLANQEIGMRICNVMASAADDVFYEWRLRELIAEDNKIVKLRFNTKIITLGKKDKIILALDNLTCHKFLDVPKLPHYAVANIVYQTSETVFLPQGVSFVGLKNSAADCIVSENRCVTAVVTDCPSNKKEREALAQKIWLEIDQVRRVNSAFLPEYKIVYEKNASVKQDAETNDLRPKNAKTQYCNVFIAGDWTMKNEPCRMETAVKSAERAVKAATRLVF